MCSYGQEDFPNFFVENLTLLNLFFIDFKICKVSRMHSYDHGRRGKKKEKKGLWTRDEEEGEMNDQSCTCKGHLHTKQRNLECCGGQIVFPNV